MTIYGLQWVQGTQTFSRPAESVFTSLTPATTVSYIAAHHSDPWASMVRCNLWDDGLVKATATNSTTATPTDACYTDTEVGSMGQVMVPLKKFWYTTDFTTANTYKWWISDNGTDTLPDGADHAWAVWPAFIRHTGVGGAAVIKDIIYTGAFEGHYNPSTLMVESKAGATPQYVMASSAWRTAAQLRAGGVTDKWEIRDWLITVTVQFLFLMEYGGFYSFGLLGKGLDAIGNTGGTTSYGNTSYGVMGDGVHPVTYRGIENFWNNAMEVIEGVGIDGTTYHLWVADHGFTDNHLTAPYVDTGLVVSLNAGSNWISNIAVNATYDYFFAPSAVAGSWGTYLCANWYQYDWGGLYTLGGEGLFGMYSHLSTYTGSDFGGFTGRLMYIG